MSSAMTEPLPGDDMHPQVMQALMHVVQLTSQKEGRPEEDVLAEFSTPEGMKAFTEMMSMAAGGAAGSLRKTRMLAEATGRVGMYMDCLGEHCPWLLADEKGASDEGEHGCLLKDCSGNLQRVYFALDLASATGFYASRFAVCMPEVKWYATEQMLDPADYVGTMMLEDCVEYMTTAPESPAKSRSQKKSLMDDDSANSGEDMEDFDGFLLSLGTEPSRQASVLLRGRVGCVDVTEDAWEGVQHLLGRCSALVCTSLLTQVGYKEPYIWTDVLQGAAPLLEEGGILLLYDSEKWGDFANVDKMGKFIEEQHLDLELVDKQEPVDYSGDVDGRMFILVFKKTKRTARKPITWLLQRAEDFKQAGNSYYSNPAKRKHPEQVVCSNPRVQVLWKAVACYVQGLDCLTLVRSALYEQEHDMASETATERERQLKLLSSRLYCNLAAAYLELGPTAQTYRHALKVVNLALDCAPDWDRAIERKAKICEVLRTQRQGGD